MVPATTKAPGGGHWQVTPLGTIGPRDEVRCHRRRIVSLVQGFASAYARIYYSAKRNPIAPEVNLYLRERPLNALLVITVDIMMQLLNIRYRTCARLCGRDMWQTLLCTVLAVTSAGRIGSIKQDRVSRIRIGPDPIEHVCK